MMIKWDLPQGCKDGSVSADQSTWYTTLTIWRVKIIYHLNRCRKSIWQNSKSNHDKTSHQSDYSGNISQHGKCHLRQTHSQHHTQEWRDESLPTKFRNKTRMPTLSLLFKIGLKVLATSIRQEKEIKVYQNRKGRGKTVIIYMTWYYIQKTLKTPHKNC